MGKKKAVNPNHDLLKTLLIKVSKLETDVSWIKKLVYMILGILLSILAKILLW